MSAVQALEKRNKKWYLFALEYVANKFNGAEAARRAGYAEKHAKYRARELLEKPEVREAIAELINNVAERVEVSAERTITEISHYAYLDPRRCFNEKGEPLELHEMDEEVARAIAGYEVTTDKDGNRTVKIKFIDKKGGNDQLGRYFKLFTDIREENINVTIENMTDSELDERIKQLLGQAGISVTAGGESET